MDLAQRRAGKDLGVCDASEQTEIGGRCESSRFSRCHFVELCHSVVETSVGWFKEQQDKPAGDREDTSSHLMAEGQPLAQVAPNSCFPTTWAEQSLQGLKFHCLRRNPGRKNCAGGSVVQGKTCLGELGQTC